VILADYIELIRPRVLFKKRKRKRIQTRYAQQLLLKRVVVVVVRMRTRRETVAGCLAVVSPLDEFSIRFHIVIVRPIDHACLCPVLLH